MSLYNLANLLRQVVLFLFIFFLFEGTTGILTLTNRGKVIQTSTNNLIYDG